jgi:translation initiation factor 2 subunit 1
MPQSRKEGKKDRKASVVLPECRFYEAEMPEKGDLVVVKVERAVEMGMYVQLLEYNGRAAWVGNEEMTLRPTRFPSKMVRIGSIQVNRVIQVDLNKGYADVSKTKVTPEAAAEKQASFRKAKAVHFVMRHVAGLHSIEAEDLCMKVSWPLHKKYRDAFEIFHRHLIGQMNVWDEIDFSRPGRDLSAIADKLKADIELHLRRRMEPSQLRFRAKVEVACDSEEGIDAVKEALQQGLRASKDGCEVKVELLCHPIFMLQCSSRDKDLGIAVLKEAAGLIEESIKSKHGHFFLRSGPDLAGQDEEHEHRLADDSPEGILAKVVTSTSLISCLGGMFSCDSDNMGELGDEYEEEACQKEVCQTAEARSGNPAAAEVMPCADSDEGHRKSVISFSVVNEEETFE